METFILTLIVSVVASALETVFRYLRDRRTRQWSVLPVVVGAVFWSAALLIVQRYRFSLNIATTLLTSVVGGLVWYGVASIVGRVLWHSMHRPSRRR